MERFDRVNLEKVERLLDFLDALADNPAARNRICLHGGTALNFFIIEPTRLSLDADINYIGSADREQMIRDRDAIVGAVRGTALELGYRVEPSKVEHAGTTMKLVYDQRRGARDFIKVDLDFLNRAPLVPPAIRTAAFDSKTISFPVNAPIEVVAGKITAISDRVVPRDLYDIGRIAETKGVWTTGDEKLDHGIITFYRGLAKSFPKNQDILARFDGREQDVREVLWPVLPADTAPSLEELKSDAAEFLEWAATPQSKAEAEFLARLALADYMPELLFSGYPAVLNAALASPAMQWKLVNLRRSPRLGRQLDKPVESPEAGRPVEAEPLASPRLNAKREEAERAAGGPDAGAERGRSRDSGPER
ncbi:nucleotidyl transferase AbiEii/AbiGii toxin family protein [Arabiibacter massiliensis]|uniref:nucleotidyl transferase AbiEii/AbiGii toxin family protein n=1 Tax=Arabiibacter massiliensis TaxID=1870985 RepID=UPI00155AFDCA|nr:nucleotidyl transferase AbiEii/AbiGii toxin family protein [Arabiibacter massiliensis]